MTKRVILGVEKASETDLGRGKPAALKFRVKADNHEVVWSSATDPGKWFHRRPSPASSHLQIETGQQSRIETWRTRMIQQCFQRSWDAVRNVDKNRMKPSDSFDFFFLKLWVHLELYVSSTFKKKLGRVYHRWVLSATHCELSRTGAIDCRDKWDSRQVS